MFCTKCGNNMEGGQEKFCPKCGTPTGAAPAPAPAVMPPQGGVAAAPKKNNKTLLIILLVAAVIGIAAFFMLRDTTGLVGTWEAESGRHSAVITFNRNGSGVIREFWDGQLDWTETFTWEVSRDGRMIGLALAGDTWVDWAEFRIIGNTLFVEGEEWTRR